ncbi:NAD(P)H-dependent oxidoreductase [bacterium]|nr:NAD(P)H-dependent oxidoreductase [bacterium]
MPKVLGLVGSPKGASSNSSSITDYLLKKLSESGLETEKLLIYAEHRRDKELEEVINKVDEANVVVVTFPLYVDSMPARLTRALELIHASRKGKKPQKDQRFVAICQCGFPESHQNNLALDMCKRFAELSGFRWIGGIPIGGGGIIGEQNLEEAGGRVKHITSALDIAASAIAEDSEIPEDAINAASKLPIPKRMYLMIGNMGWNSIARKNGLKRRQMFAKPYERSN